MMSIYTESSSNVLSRRVNVRSFGIIPLRLDESKTAACSCINYELTCNLNHPGDVGTKDPESGEPRKSSILWSAHHIVSETQSSFCNESRCERGTQPCHKLRIRYRSSSGLQNYGFDKKAPMLYPRWISVSGIVACELRHPVTWLGMGSKWQSTSRGKCRATKCWMLLQLVMSCRSDLNFAGSENVVNYYHIV
jgi:hypothetical protein